MLNHSALLSLLEQVETLVAEVGVYQCAQFRRRAPGGGDQKAEREFVSEVDRHSEALLIDGLTPLCPTAGFFGEESGKHGDQSLCWVIDPLDGTTNFLSGLDQFSISVALQQNGQSLLGMVYKPVTKECFRGWRGGALQHNGQSCRRANPQLTLAQALLGTGFPYRSPDLAAPFFACAAELLPQSRGIRRMGSAALDLSYLAAGYLQGFWEADLQPYDVAAGLLFLELSGCHVTNQAGQPYRQGVDRLLVCGWPQVHAAMLATIATHYPSIT
ncbi:MAG TPA: inositol monophosphatase [Motiliproteus sp.]